MILLAILKARKLCDTIDQLIDNELEIHASEYMNAFDVNKTTSYRALKSAVLGLFDAKWGYRYINNSGNVAVRYERFIQSAEYVEKEAIVKFTFAKAIVPMLVELERNFTSYEIKQVANLQSRYAMRLYEMLVQFRSTKNLKISLSDLRYRLGLLETEYETMSNFKKYVLDKAVGEINEHSDLLVGYDQIKDGRTITGFCFKFEIKKYMIIPSKIKNKNIRSLYI